MRTKTLSVSSPKLFSFTWSFLTSELHNHHFFGDLGSFRLIGFAGDYQSHIIQASKSVRGQRALESLTLENVYYYRDGTRIERQHSDCF